MAITSHDIQFVGFHKFRRDDGTEYGSFEVFYENGDDPLVKVGWYWWLAHKGCIAESAATGPFPTAEGALLDALEGSDPYHGMSFPTPESWKTAAEHINFLDELEQASPDLQEGFTKLVEGRSILNHKLGGGNA